MALAPWRQAAAAARAAWLGRCAARLGLGLGLGLGSDLGLGLVLGLGLGLGWLGLGLGLGMARTLRSAPVACAVGLSAASHRLTTTPASSSTYDTHGPSGWGAEP